MRYVSKIVRQIGLIAGFWLVGCAPLPEPTVVVLPTIAIATEFAQPTMTAPPATALPTRTATTRPIIAATATPVPTETARPTATATLLPTDTPTPLPSETPTPMPIPTETPPPASIRLFDFESPTAANDWYIVNDGVMGGVSGSQFEVSSGKLLFVGNVSLENNGGFASIRSRFYDWQNTADTNAVRIRVLGDGKLYRLQLYQATVNYTYEAFFRTVEDQWIDVTIPYSDFVPLIRGFAVRNPVPIEPAQISGAGIIIQDKQPGTFRIALDWLDVVQQ